MNQQFKYLHIFLLYHERTYFTLVEQTRTEAIYDKTWKNPLENFEQPRNDETLGLSKLHLSPNDLNYILHVKKLMIKKIRISMKLANRNLSSKGC